MNHRTSYVIFAMLCCILVACTGCTLISQRQLENKLPRVNAAKASVTGSTIYGVSGELTVTNLKNVGGEKSAKSYHYRLTSPLGTFEVNAEGVSMTIEEKAEQK
jgi:hypothetical protein